MNVDIFSLKKMINQKSLEKMIQKNQTFFLTNYPKGNEKTKRNP